MARTGRTSERRAAALAHVRELLHLHGATDEEIDQALADDVLDLFVFDRRAWCPPAAATPGARWRN